MSTSDPSDIRFMRQALALAEQGRGRASPNPMVGAVVARDGVIVGQGFHPEAGKPHAEVFALQDAGERARGGVLYVTLEPCCAHGRTPPCTDAVIQAGIARVVAAMEDPDARVSGRGFTILRKAGLDVHVGTLAAEAHRLNEAYIHHRRTGCPFVALKLAQSLDGRIATASRHSQWITGAEARRYAHRLRSEADGILVGVETVLTDDPQLTVRHVEGRRPKRIVLDSRARTPASARILAADEAGAIICVTGQAPETHIETLRAAGVEIAPLPATADGTVDIPAVLRYLGARRIVTLLVEGGSRVATAFLREQAVQKLVMFVAPRILGEGISTIGDLGITSVDAAITLRDVTLDRVGADFVVTGYPVYE